MKLDLVVHPSREGAAAVAEALVAEASSRGMTVTASAEDAGRVAGAEVRPSDTLPGGDVIVAVGGDGTMLEAVRLGLATGLPVLGVNAGHIGFLAAVEPEGTGAALDALAAGDWQESSRMTLAAQMPGSEPVAGINDVVVEKVLSQHVVKIGVSVGTERLVCYRADAVVVATPTGSTAYTFSAGGPLVDPELEALIVTAVAPHNLFARPLVFGPDTRLQLGAEGDRPARVNVDGRCIGELDPGDTVEVWRGDSAARLVVLSPRHFGAAVREKFGLHDA
jgi:NAD+ kinase